MFPLSLMRALQLSWLDLLSNLAADHPCHHFNKVKGVTSGQNCFELDAALRAKVKYQSKDD